MSDHVQPRVGMLATVRNRRGLISAVDVQAPSTSEPRTLHLVQVDYLDHDGVPSETLLWEREPGRRLTEPRSLPMVLRDAPMVASEFDAMVRSARWSAITPFIGPDGAVADLPLAAPFHGGVQTEEYQLVPLLRALQMPRISLLIADDVGLGKTVEAGLILAELLIRRRVRRVLILCPASLRGQWQQELMDKFSLSFDVIDRAEAVALQRRLGPDANAWRAFPRSIASYHYLRQPDVREQFLATCRSAETLAGHAAQLPWDLLIVDEAHNLMPSNFGADSDLAETLRLISPWFEHKIFLTATPHNGHTRCFSGLLEALDPVRFTQTADFTDLQKRRIGDVVIRRLKREINALDEAAGRTPRFARRHLEGLPIYLHRAERELASAFASFRARVKQLIARSSRGERTAGSFAIEVLNKRLLSCPRTFADSWARFREGLYAGESADLQDVHAARRAVEEEMESDHENTSRGQQAARTIGAWLHAHVATLGPLVQGIDAALAALGLAEPTALPRADARYERLKKLVEERLRQDGAWQPGERLIVFTEYKTTLDYLEQRLKRDFKDDDRAIRVLYGGMPGRDAVRAAFNDPADPVRVLLATDAASEGLNLQETARLLLHFEIPWNPSRMEQRNGRIDRHGQPRDVTIYHFTSEDDADLKFVAHVLAKVNEIRDDLGAMGEVFDAAFQRRFQELDEAEDVTRLLDSAIEKRVSVELPSSADAPDERPALQAVAAELDLSPETLQQTVATAMGGRGLEGPDAEKRYRVTGDVPPEWRPILTETIADSAGAMRRLLFDPRGFLRAAGRRTVFRPDRGTVLLHLGHPLVHLATSRFAFARLSSQGGASRWTVRRSAHLPSGQAQIRLTLEELAINDLRETFHANLRTLVFPVFERRLGPAEPHLAPGQDPPPGGVVHPEDIPVARQLWDELRPDVDEAVRAWAEQLTTRMKAALDQVRDQALETTKRQFDQRIGEVRRAMSDNTLDRMKQKVETEREQLKLHPFTPESKKRIIEASIRDLEEEISRRESRYEDLLRLLNREQRRVLRLLVPSRYRLLGAVQVLPVAVEIRLGVA